MKYSHWELLLCVYQQQNSFSKIKPLKIQCNKTLLKTCIKNKWIKENDDGTVEVTTDGYEAAKEIAPLHKREFSNTGQTY